MALMSISEDQLYGDYSINKRDVLIDKKTEGQKTMKGVMNLDMFLTCYASSSPIAWWPSAAFAQLGLVLLGLLGAGHVLLGQAGAQ